MYAYIMQFGRLLSKPPQAVFTIFLCAFCLYVSLTSCWPLNACFHYTTVIDCKAPNCAWNTMKIVQQLWGINTTYSNTLVYAICSSTCIDNTCCHLHTLAASVGHLSRERNTPFKGECNTFTRIHAVIWYTHAASAAAIVLPECLINWSDTSVPKHARFLLTWVAR